LSHERQHADDHDCHDLLRSKYKLKKSAPIPRIPNRFALGTGRSSRDRHKNLRSLKPQTSNLKPQTSNLQPQTFFHYLRTMSIKNIIFDLGGVLLDIDFGRTDAAFRGIGISNFNELYSKAKASPLFDALEKGEAGEAAFYEGIRRLSGKNLSDEAIEAAWNTILVKFEPERMQWLERVQQRYRIFLLSNTNSIHHRRFQQMLRDTTGKKSLDDYFEKAYYSHCIGCRKPAARAYTIVLEENKLLPEETLFIDDSAVNIEGATAVGLKTMHLHATMNLLNLENYTI
jgi:glucose-1-phosphatase